VAAATGEPGGTTRLLSAARTSLRELARGRATGSQAARISIASIAVLIALSFGGYFVRVEANRWQGGRTNVLMEFI
jgi:hypothetical protein